MKLSVIVPVYNGAPTLERCLAALVAALPAGGEIVVVDDASTDSSSTIAARHPVRLVQREVNGGASAARNHGITAADGELLAFVDADVVVRPDALRHLVSAMSDPARMGANGLFALDLSTPGRVTAFTNTSIHYQHLRHGAAVASAFTGLCVLRREALGRMGGFDARTSRFADDVGTRWHLPSGSIALVAEAQGDHLKAVTLGGLLRHRRTVGWHFVTSVLDNWGAARARPETAVLALRYPLNTLAAALTLAALPVAPFAPLVLVLPVGLLLSANADFVRFTFTHRGPVDALVALPISALEGYAYGIGMTLSLADHLRRSLDRAPTSAR